MPMGLGHNQCPQTNATVQVFWRNISTELCFLSTQLSQTWEGLCFQAVHTQNRQGNMSEGLTPTNFPWRRISGQGTKPCSSPTASRVGEQSTLPSSTASARTRLLLQAGTTSMIRNAEVRTQQLGRSAFPKEAGLHCCEPAVRLS